MSTEQANGPRPGGPAGWRDPRHLRPSPRCCPPHRSPGRSPQEAAGDEEDLALAAEGPPSSTKFRRAASMPSTMSGGTPAALLALTTRERISRRLYQMVNTNIFWCILIHVRKCNE